MAHPYAPMGGCYDDRVVGIVVEEFLKLGWVVGTFNFRHGALFDVVNRANYFIEEQPDRTAE